LKTGSGFCHRSWFLFPAVELKRKVVGIATPFSNLKRIICEDKAINLKEATLVDREALILRRSVGHIFRSKTLSYVQLS